MNYSKKLSNKGSITIEASLVFVIFFIAYILINNIAVSIMTESLTRKALFETGEEVKAYVRILDEIDLSNILKTKKIDSKDYKNLILQSIEKINDNNIDTSLFNEIKDLAIEDSKSFAKNKSYEKIVKQIFINKLYDIKNIKDISFLGVVNNQNGFNFSDTRILEDPGVITLSVNYDINLDKFGIFSFKDTVNQSFNYMVNLNGRSFKKEKNNSIWNEKNFTRGRYFANFIRENYKGKPIEIGGGLDLYDKDNNTIYQTFSINIFEKSYSNKVNDTYLINEGFMKLLVRYRNELRENIEKSKNEIIIQNKETIKINSPKEKLIIVLPEEAKDMTNLDEYKDYIKKEIGDVDFIYLEKAFDDN